MEKWRAQADIREFQISTSTTAKITLTHEMLLLCNIHQSDSYKASEKYL